MSLTEKSSFADFGAKRPFRTFDAAMKRKAVLFLEKRVPLMKNRSVRSVTKLNESPQVKLFRENKTKAATINFV